MEQSSTAIETGYRTTNSKRGDLVILIGLAAITLISVITAVSGTKKKKKEEKLLRSGWKKYTCICRTGSAC